MSTLSLIYYTCYAYAFKEILPIRRLDLWYSGITMAKKSTYSIIIPVGMKPRPKMHEETAADILAAYFSSDVYFIKTETHETPDVSIEGIKWEIKSPTGGSANSMQKNMREASTQSENIVLDLRRSKLHQSRALGYIKQFADRSKKLKRVLVITKSRQILTIK